MLRRVLKGFFCLLGLILVVGGGLYFFASHKYETTASRIHEDPSLALSISTQEAWAKEGERLARTKGCFDCHGADLGGTTFINEPPIGVFTGTNLTPGRGGIGKTYTDQDWVRAIRYGRGPNHRYLMFMPSAEFAALTDEDLAKIISYLKTVPAVDREQAPSRPGPMAKILYAFGKMPLLFTGEFIDLKNPPPQRLEPSETAEYGRYLAAGCVGCHGQNYQGGPIPGVPPHWPAAANLTPKGRFATWSYEDFERTMTSGKLPDGRELNPQFMPWPMAAAMTKGERKALFLFLKSLPEAEAAN